MLAQTNTFPDSGNVGVGTLAPAANLDVGGTEAAGALRSVLARQGEGNANGSGTFLGVRAWGTQNTAYGGKMFSIENTFYGDLNSSIEFYRGGGTTGGFMAFTTGAGVERLRIDADGNVGIGTTAPGGYGKFAVVGNVATISPDTGHVVWLNIDNAGCGSLNAYSGTGAYLRFTTTSTAGSNAEQMRIDQSGNVGIGTTTPTGRLEVKRGNGEIFRLSGNTANHFLTFYNADDGTNRYTAIGQGTAATSPITFYNPSSASKLGISIRNLGGNWNCLNLYNNDSYGGIQSTNNLSLQPTSGNVGIGTTNPTNKLEVNGTIRTKEVIVETTGWSDYVFAPDYRLAPLSEVKAHIAATGHLPGIPSAAEVADKGVSVGDMQVNLLAKVEELTLHLIALEEENAALKARVSSLETASAEVSP